MLDLDGVTTYKAEGKMMGYCFLFSTRGVWQVVNGSSFCSPVSCQCCSGWDKGDQRKEKEVPDHKVRLEASINVTAQVTEIGQGQGLMKGVMAMATQKVEEFAKEGGSGGGSNSNDMRNDS
ncbi:hypothetical protein Leryth_011089 [Lithospermum erythrorhizon]|nr:hypothetical protein Leryth_011089 [Lithospermum erythrorhizon]